MGIDYEAVLEDLRAKRDELNAAIAAIERIVRAGAASTSAAANGEAEGGAPSASGTEEPPPPPESRQIREDSFFGLSATAAARKYLTMVRRPAVTQEIVDALRQGGFLTEAKNFYSNLYTTLKRNDSFTNLGKGKWGLTEWYPNRPRKKPKPGSAASESDEEDGSSPSVP